MPRDLFGDVTRPSISIGNRKWYAVPVSLLSHVAIVATAVVVPLLATDVLPVPPYECIDVFVDPVPPPPPPPPPPTVRTPPPTDLPPNRDAAPITAPDGITDETPIDPGFETHGTATGIVIGTPDPSVVLAPPPPPPERRDPVPVGGAIRPPQKIKEVPPVYPPMAQAARIQGIVIIEATIAADGHVEDARILRSVPLLDEAALTAVRQWRFTPTLLNGVPVPVIMTVTVNFRLK